MNIAFIKPKFFIIIRNPFVYYYVAQTPFVFFFGGKPVFWLSRLLD